MTDIDRVHGPIDYLLVQFPADADTSAAGAALLDLVTRGVVRIYDLLVIRKSEDGSFSGMDITDISDHGLGGFTAFAGVESGLLQDSDIAEAAGVMDPGTAALLMPWRPRHGRRTC